MGHETYIYMFLSFFAIVLGEVIEREKSFILHSSALTSPVLLHAVHPEGHGSVRRPAGATQERGHFRSADLGGHGGAAGWHSPAGCKDNLLLAVLQHTQRRTTSKSALIYEIYE